MASSRQEPAQISRLMEEMNMAYTLDKVDVWAGTIEDRPGGLAEKLEGLAEVGVNLEFIIARRQHDKAGTGVVFVAPISGATAIRLAKKIGLAKADDLFSVRLEGADKAGFAARIAQTLAAAGINLRGFSGASLGRRCVIYFSFDSKTDAGKAIQLLKKELKI